MNWLATTDIEAVGRELHERYANAAPYPHIVLDELFDPTMLTQVAREFPDLPRDSRSIGYDDPNQVKFASRGTAQFPPLTAQLLTYLNSPAFIGFLGAMTGIDGLLPDPTFEGGGLHEIQRGGFLKIHADFDKHRVSGNYRRLNALLYLNEDWAESYGGELQLWSRDMSECAKKIAPIFNRLVVFTTDDTSYHGHPELLTCPPERRRRSLALYYYTELAPSDVVSQAEDAGHSTLFRDRPHSDDATRTYQPRLSTRVKRTLRKVRAAIRS